MQCCAVGAEVEINGGHFCAISQGKSGRAKRLFPGRRPLARSSKVLHIFCVPQRKHVLKTFRIRLVDEWNSVGQILKGDEFRRLSGVRDEGVGNLKDLLAANRRLDQITQWEADVGSMVEPLHSAVQKVSTPGREKQN